MPAASAQERVPGLVHQSGHLRGLGDDRQGAGLDAPRIQQVADQAAHVIGLLVDDPEELEHLGRVQGGRGAQHGGGRALDGGQRGPQLVAHHAQELGPQPLQLLQRRQVLHGDDHRLDLTVLGPDRRGVDQRRDTPAVGDREHDLLGAHRLGAAQLPGQREFGEGHLPPIGAPHGHHLQQLLRGAARQAQAPDNPLRLPIERHRMAGPGIEDHDTHRRGVDQGLQVGPDPLLGPVRAGVGDRRRRLRREQHQHLFVRRRELLSAVLLGEKEVADRHAPMPHRRSLEGLRPHQVRGKAARPDVAGQVAQA